MTDPVSLTASTIVNLAIQKFIESSAGELAKKFTADAITKIDDLYKKIWNRLRGKSENLDNALNKIEKQRDPIAVNTLSKYLDVAMEDDPIFAKEIQQLAREIDAGKIQDNSNMKQEVFGSNNMNVQAKAEQGGKQFIAEKMFFGITEET
jgi:hypothetical protein